MANISGDVQKAIESLNVLTSRCLISEKDIVYDVEKMEYVSNSQGISGIRLDSNGINSVGYACVVLKSKEGIDVDVTAGELMDFMTFLVSERSFGYKHKVGEKIYSAIKRMWDNQEYEGLCKEYYYHSRPIEKGQTPYLFQEMLKAPYGVTGAGRYNYPGVAYYYTADTKEGAEEQVKCHNKGKGIQTVKIKPRHPAKLLDLSRPKRWGKEFLRYIRFDVGDDVDSTLPSAYLIPNYVSDCCRRVGYDGIKYYGGSDYCNYVVWRDEHYDYVEML